MKEIIILVIDKTNKVIIKKTINDGEKLYFDEELEYLHKSNKINDAPKVYDSDASNSDSD